MYFACVDHSLWTTLKIVMKEDCFDMKDFVIDIFSLDPTQDCQKFVTFVEEHYEKIDRLGVLDSADFQASSGESVEDNQHDVTQIIDESIEPVQNGAL